VAYGYRYGEVPLPTLPEKEGSAEFGPRPPLAVLNEALGPNPVVNKKLETHNPLQRNAAYVDLGTPFYGAAYPHADTDDPDTLRAGAYKRVALAAPPCKPGTHNRMKLFVRKFCEKNLTPLSPDFDFSNETWMENSNYPYWRQQELINTDIEIRLGNLKKPSKHRVDSFGKDEGYPEYKHVRIINAGTDWRKLQCGAIFKAIEEEVFKLRYFVKKVPVRDRPKYIMEQLFLEGNKYYPTDYTSFESLFVEELMDACEFELYRYMTEQLNQNEKFRKFCEEVLGGTNECMYKWFRLYIHAKRMSGEMCTSLGNGFSNLIFTKFVAHEHSLKVKSIHEGDDGLISSDSEIKQVWFEELGLRIKIEEIDDISSASFCGIIFDPKDLQNITNPLKVLANFGWTSNQYWGARESTKRALLRSKALSLIYEYPGCPVVQELALYALRHTRDVKRLTKFTHGRRDIDMFMRQRILSAIEFQDLPVAIPGVQTRHLMEQEFGITVEMQLKIESYLRSLDHLQVLQIPYLLPLYHNDCIHYWDNYVMNDVFGRFPPLTHLYPYDGFVKEF
jgi:hypothetical protein